MVDDHDAIWRALADPTRRGLLDLLAAGPRTTGDLCQAFSLSRFAVMKHLGVLEDAGLVLARKQGREVWNHLNAVPLRAVYGRWIGAHTDRLAAGALGIKALAEGRGGTMSEGTPAGPTWAPDRMHIEQEVPIAAPPGRVYEALTRDVAAWWGPPYTSTAAPEHITLDAQLGGHFLELGAGGELVLLGVVTALRPGHYLELTGPCGLERAAHSLFRLALEPAGDGSVLRLSHWAVGEFSDHERVQYAQGWGELLGHRLKAFVERGERLGLGGP